MAEAKVQRARYIWLQYFNRYLFETGIITEAERNQLHIKIKQSSKNRS